MLRIPFCKLKVKSLSQNKTNNEVPRKWSILTGILILLYIKGSNITHCGLTFLTWERATFISSLQVLKVALLTSALQISTMSSMLCHLLRQPLISKRTFAHDCFLLRHSTCDCHPVYSAGMVLCFVHSIRPVVTHEMRRQGMSRLS